MAAWWPFGRRQRDAPATTDDPRSARTARRPRRRPSNRRLPSNAWRDLPPLRPSAPAIELTAPVQRLADTMTSKQHTGVTRTSWGTFAPPTVPAGTVVGLLKPQRRDAPRAHRSRAADLRRGSARAGRRRVGGAVASAPNARPSPRPITPRATTGRGGGAGRADRTGSLVRATRRRRRRRRRLDDRSAPPVPSRARNGCRPRRPNCRPSRRDRCRLASATGACRAARVAATAARSPVADAPVAPSGVGGSVDPTVDHRIGSEAPRHDPAGAARRDHPHRAAHRRAAAGAPGEHGLDRRFTCRWHDVRLRWRSLPASPGSRTTSRPARQPVVAPSPGWSPPASARRVASIDVRVERARGRNAVPPAAGVRRRHGHSSGHGPRSSASPTRRPSLTVLRTEPTGDEPVTDHDPVPVRWGPVGGTSGATSTRGRARRPADRARAGARHAARRRQGPPRPRHGRGGAPAQRQGVHRRRRGVPPRLARIDEHGRGAHDPHPRTDPRRPATATRRLAAGRGVTGGCRARIEGAIGRRARSSRADAARRAEPVRARRAATARRAAVAFAASVAATSSPSVRRNGRRWDVADGRRRPACRPPPVRPGSRRLRRPPSAWPRGPHRRRHRPRASDRSSATASVEHRATPAG